MKLKEYYDAEGSHDPILIQFPKGHYLPIFEIDVGLDSSRCFGMAEARPRTRCWLTLAVRRRHAANIRKSHTQSSNALVSGVMGLEPAHHDNPFDVLTLSRLPGDHDRTTLSAVSIRKNHLDITHTGRSSKRLKNVSGPALRWRAAFAGTVSQVHVDGTSVTARQSRLAGGAVVSWADVTVSSGTARVVSR
jgi:hypothetical protein